MENDNQSTGGAISFEFMVETGMLERATEESIRRIKGVVSTVEREGNRIDETFRKIGAGIAAYLSFQQLDSLIRKIADVRGEFQQLEISFETMLKNKALSDKLMADVVEFAAKTPFDLQQVATGAKQLLAYGTEVQNIIPTMRQLGDVASGLSIPFSDLVYLYGTSATQGKLMTKDLMQFAGRGIPIIDELSKILKVSKAEVMNLSEQGKIGFGELQQVIENLTSSTGMFAGMMEKQAEAINGLRSNLGDAWDQMLNDIGQANEDTIEDTIKTTTSIVENYQRVLDILKVLVATYGVHRAAVILNTVAMAAYNTTMDWAIIKTKLLNLALKNNPGGLALSAITALIGGIWAYNRAMAATPSLVASIRFETSKEIISLNSVFESLKNAKEGTDKRAEAIKIINDRYTKYLDNLLTEKSTIEDIEKAQKRATNALIADISVKQNKAKLEESLGEIASSFDSSFEGFLKVYSDTYGAERIGEFISSINEGVDKEIKARGGVIDRGVLEYSDFAKKVYDQFVSEISQQSGFLKYSFDEFQKSFLDFAQFKAGQLPFVSQMQATIASFQSMIDSFNPEGGGTNGGTPDTTKQTLSERLKEIQQMYENYYRWVERYGKESADKQFSNLISGSESYLEYLERQIKKLESKPKKSTQDVNDLSTYLGAKDDLTGAKTSIELFEVEVDKAKEKYSDLVDYINYLKSSLLAVGAFDGSEQSFTKIKILTEQLSEAERDFVKESINTYQKAIEEAAGFAEKRLLIEKEYAAELKKLDPVSLGQEKYDEAIAALEKIKTKKLLEVLKNEVEATEAYKKLTNEFERLTAGEASSYLITLKKQLEALKAQPEIYNLINNLINEIEGKLANTKAEKLSDILSESSRLIDTIAGQLEGVDESFAAIARGISSVVSQLGAASQAFAVNASTGKATNPMQGFSSLAGIFFTIADGLDKQFGMQKKIADIEANRAEYNRQMSMTLESITSELDRQLNLLDDLSIGQSYNPSVEALRASIRATSEELENLRLDFAQAPPNFKITFDISHLKKIFQTDDTAKALNQAFSEGLITEEQYNLAVQYLSTIEDAEERLKDLHEEYKEAIFGTTSDSITNAIIEGLLAGKRGIKDFAGTFEDMMKQAIINSMLVKALQPAIDNWMNTWMAVANDEDGLTPADLSSLRYMAEGIVNWAGDLTDQVTSMFPDIFDGLESMDSLSGAIKGVSEETAGLIAGQMNAIRINQAHALALMDEQLAYQMEIAHNTKALHAILNELRKKSPLGGSASSSIRANGGE